jgi:hypothetical protein
MTLHSLLYISRSMLAPDEAQAAVQAIVALSIVRNAEAGLTGALICTGRYFAQVLEGDSAAIETLMERLRRDVRQTDMLVVDHEAIAQRHFGDWSMAYIGPSQFVSQHVTRLLSDPPQPQRRRAAKWLIELMREFLEST